MNCPEELLKSLIDDLKLQCIDDSSLELEISADFNELVIAQSESIRNLRTIKSLTNEFKDKLQRGTVIRPIEGMCFEEQQKLYMIVYTSNILNNLIIFIKDKAFVHSVIEAMQCIEIIVMEDKIESVLPDHKVIKYKLSGNIASIIEFMRETLDMRLVQNAFMYQYLQEFYSVIGCFLFENCQTFK
jgi:hypothetical protein